MRNIFGYFLIFISVMLFAYVIFISSNVSKKNQTFSPYTFLLSSWEKYKVEYINKDGRVIDHSLDSITTSEGQSYAMLRALWVGDKNTFDSVWNWTKNNLKRPSDNLFGWRWGQKSDGTYGFKDEADQNSASDADIDITLALILASRRWNDRSYLEPAKLILEDIWRLEVAEVNQKNYLTAGNWAENRNQLVINPSYFAPYAFKIFAQIDDDHDWESLIAPGYELLNRSSKENLDKDKSVGLPPDWISLDKSTEQIASVSGSPDLTTNYGYDAVRIPWRIALDYQWNKSQEALKYLKNSFSFLVNEYKDNKKLVGIYSHDGKVVRELENPVMYATAIGFLDQTNQSSSKKIYQEKILSLYSNDTDSFNSNLPYYEQNWLWFGAALYNKYLKNFNNE